ncbi:hypothetical protein [Pararhodonellum marinum]|uniref:hypothetical protein n=1 Tax=Pararhodonellum marinum TaxID=2755358 RepID=UPI00188F8D23|nr:hypothetical protein [Pararhodonellum marinum]
MIIRYSKHYLDKLENLFAESEYILRYEKGNFKSGYCILRDTKVVIVNKYYTLEGKINTLVDIIKEIQMNPQQFQNKKNQDFLSELQQIKLKL